MEIEEAEDIIDIWKETYPGVAQWQQEQEQRTRRDGHVCTPGGRRWDWDWNARSGDDPKLDELEDWQIDDALSGYQRN